LDIWDSSLIKPFDASELDERARAWIRDKGQELLDLIESVKPEPSPKQPFKSQRQSKATITSDDIVGEIVSSYTDWSGKVIGRSFFKGGIEFRIYGDGYLRFREISEAIGSKNPFRHKISQEFCDKAIFLWCTKRLKEGDLSHLDELLIDEAEKAVQDFTIYCPLFGIEVESDLILGDIVLAIIPESVFRPTADDASPDMIAGLAEMSKSYANLTAVQFSCNTESGLAEELVFEAAELVCSILRFISPASVSHNVAYPCAPLGSEQIAKGTTIYVKDSRVSLLSNGLRNRGLFNWKLSHAEIHNLMNRPMGNAFAFLENRKLNEFQGCLKRALLSYSRGVGQFDLHERLVAAVGALETLFLPNGSDGTLSTVGERLAFFVSDRPDERKSIVKNYSYIYKIRSKYLHHNVSVKDEIEMEKFFRYVWRAFYLLLARFGKYHSHRDFIDDVDSTKFGVALENGK